jgi:enterochelin esterase family protein
MAIRLQESEAMSKRIFARISIPCITGVIAFAQAPPAPGGRGRGPQTPPVISPDVAEGGQVTFRLSAPKAQNVRIGDGDIPNTSTRGVMTKGADGVWSVTIPLDPGAYRYSFNVDGITVVDPRNGAVSESLSNVWSLVVVPGSEYFDTKEVPHGAVASVTYWSSALKKFRRMHVYTPPGYESNKEKYPVFYLLHGSGDNDDAWTSVGRAGFILDNLIAMKKAKPMVVIMPASHTRTTTGGGGRGAASTDPNVPSPPDEFTQDFLTDVMPYAESHYRIIADRGHRAIAGLSLGGSQTLNVVVPHLDKFSYIGVFSSGLLGVFRNGRGGRGAAAAPPPAGTLTGAALWESQHKAELNNASWKKGLKLVWFSTGKDDSLITSSRSTVDLLNKYGYNATFHESTGAHTWINWRNYLVEFAPQLFQ